MSQDNAQKLQQLQKRIEEIKQRKTSAEAEVKLLHQRYEEEVVKAKELGIENVDDLPTLINQQEEEEQTQLQNLEAEVNSVEQALQENS
jgi:molecular chaperone GrpE (heat shock protein)